MVDKSGYDTQGIRTMKQDSQGLQRYLIDQVSVLADYDALGAQTARYTLNPQRIDEMLGQHQEQGKFYHLADGLGSVYGLTNEAGVKVASYGYDAYGATTDSQSPAGLRNRWMYTGRELDADSGLQYNRARYYLSGVGSWNREDPVFSQQNSLLGKLFRVEETNRFAYAKCSPSFYSDASGQITDDCWKAIKDLVFAVLDAIPMGGGACEIGIDVFAFFLYGAQLAEGGTFHDLYKKDRFRFWLGVIATVIQVAAFVAVLAGISREAVSGIKAWIVIVVAEAMTIVMYSYAATGSWNPLAPCFRGGTEEDEQ